MSKAPGQTRIAYLDIAKGIGILLVVLGHCTAIPEWLNHLIFSVHMPLFFILSGVTFSRKNLENPKRSILKNAKALLIPYGLTALLIVLLQVLRALKNQEEVLPAAVKWIITGLYGTGTHYLPCMDELGIPVTFIGAIWFLLALFFAKVLLLLILRSKASFLWVMVCFFAGYVSARRIGWLPFSIQAGFCAVLFLYIGFVIKEKDLFRWDAVHWVLKLLLLGVWIYCVIHCGRLWMVSNSYTDGFLDIIGGISGSFVIVYIARGLEKIGFLRKILVWLGMASLGIMCAHVIVLDCFPVSRCSVFLMSHLGISYCIGEIITVFIGTAVVTAVLYVIPRMNSRMFPASFPGKH